MIRATRAVTFENRQGLRLVGMLHEPAAPSDLAVLLLSPGVKNRIAPHRLYNRIADLLVAQGCWVFRFDFYGLGDSEGEIGEALLADLYGSVALGRYVDDTRDGIAWMKAHTPARRFIVGGLCGGAITGLLAAEGLPDVVGLLGLGLPINVDGSGVDKVQAMTHGQLDRVRAGYLRKLVDPRSWARLLSFQSDWRLLVRSLVRRAPAKAAATAAVEGVNPRFAPAFFSFLAGPRHMLLVFSETDRLWWEFDEKFLSRHPEVRTAYGDRLVIGVVPGANHIFTLEEWQQDAMTRIRTWVAAAFGGGPASADRTPPTLAPAAEGRGRR